MEATGETRSESSQKGIGCESHRCGSQVRKERKRDGKVREYRWEKGKEEREYGLNE